MNPLELRNEADRNLGRMLEIQGAAIGDTVFLHQDDVKVTYDEGDSITNRVARGLADLGVGKGDRVAFLMSNAMEVVYLVFAVNKLGAIWIPINVEYKGEWLRDTLAMSKPKVIVTDRPLYTRLAEVMDKVPHDHVVVLQTDTRDLPQGTKSFASLYEFSDKPLDLSKIGYGDVSAVLWTSGTTGKSKGVQQSHNVWIRSATGPNNKLNYDTRPGDVGYNVLPMYNSAAWTANIFRCIAAGITCALDQSFSVQHFWDRTRFYNATQTFTLGAMHIWLWKQPPQPNDRDNPVRCAGMAPMPDDILEPFKERFGIERISQGFGQSEILGVCGRPPNRKWKPGALGAPNPDLEIKLTDDDGNEVPVGQPGEFTLKPKLPHMMFEGYFDNPEANAAALTKDGWYKMGDLGRKDEDGDYFFVDRKKDAVRFAGRNISTMEVESAIRPHPAVKDVAVFGIKSAELEAEDELAMHIVVNPGIEVTHDEIARFINDNAPRYFVPRYIEFVESLPYTPTNKVQKYLLRQRGITDATWDRNESGFEVTR